MPGLGRCPDLRNPDLEGSTVLIVIDKDCSWNDISVGNI